MFYYFGSDSGIDIVEAPDDDSAARVLGESMGAIVCDCDGLQFFLERIGAYATFRCESDDRLIFRIGA